MLSQEMAFQTMTINGFHHRFHQVGKILYEPFQFLVVGIFQNRIVQISD